MEGLIFGILRYVFIGHCRVVQSNHVNMDTEGAIECVRLNWVSILSRLNVEKIQGLGTRKTVHIRRCRPY